MKRIEYDYSSRVKIITIIEFRKITYVTTAINLLESISVFSEEQDFSYGYPSWLYPNAQRSMDVFILFIQVRFMFPYT